MTATDPESALLAAAVDTIPAGTAVPIDVLAAVVAGLLGVHVDRVRLVRGADRIRIMVDGVALTHLLWRAEDSARQLGEAVLAGRSWVGEGEGWAA